MKHAREDYNGAIVDLRDPSLADEVFEHFDTDALLDRIDSPVFGTEDLRELVQTMFRQVARSLGGSPIGVDEPVFLVRAQDTAAPAAVRAWAERAKARGASPEIVGAALVLAAMMVDWQELRGSKVPDLPAAAEEDAGDA